MRRRVGGGVAPALTAWTGACETRAGALHYLRQKSSPGYPQLEDPLVAAACASELNSSPRSCGPRASSRAASSSGLVSSLAGMCPLPTVRSPGSSAAGTEPLQTVLMPGVLLQLPCTVWKALTLTKALRQTLGGGPPGDTT